MRLSGAGEVKKVFAEAAVVVQVGVQLLEHLLGQIRLRSSQNDQIYIFANLAGQKIDFVYHITVGLQRAGVSGNIRYTVSGQDGNCGRIGICDVHDRTGHGFFRTGRSDVSAARRRIRFGVKEIVCGQNLITIAASYNDIARVKGLLGIFLSNLRIGIKIQILNGDIGGVFGVFLNDFVCLIVIGVVSGKLVFFGQNSDRYFLLQVFQVIDSLVRNLKDLVAGQVHIHGEPIRQHSKDDVDQHHDCDHANGHYRSKGAVFEAPVLKNIFHDLVSLICFLKGRSISSNVSFPEHGR